MPTHPATRTNHRLYLLARNSGACGAGGICLRLVYLQIFRYGDFEQRAQHQQQRTIEVSARRGIIYDRDGRELAMSVSVDSVFAVPSEIPDLAGTISLISTHHQGLIPANCWRSAKLRGLLLGGAQGRRRNRATASGR